jgi:outer membrane receptor protein involved in Fe transport
MNKNTAQISRSAALLALLTSGPLASLFAQSKEAANVAAEPITTLEKFTVKGVSDADQIMPTIRPIGSVMGDARSILDTPRSVSSISKELMEQVRIKSVTDFSQFAPGVYTAARYGLATTPMVRGDLAELYFDGQRVKYSRDSVMPSFNGIEALDIVKGPGSAVYGPQSNGASGYTNFVTKKPYFDKQRTEFSLSYAGITADHDYSNLEWQVDTGGPLSGSTAYRASYLGRTGKTYYQNTKDETQDIYAALTHKFDKTLTFNWWIQAYHQTYGEVSGINRPTQALIDHSTYLAGKAVLAGGVYTIANPQLVNIKAYKSAVGTADIAHADRFQTQGVLTKELSATSYIKNSSYFETRTSDKYEPGITYSEYVKTDWNVQNRTEYHGDFKSGSVANSFITGIDLKVERLISYQSFFGEEYNFQDLSKPASLFSNPGTNIYVFGVPGHNKFGTDIGYGNPSGNQDSKLSDAAVFYQHDIKFTSNFSAIVGYRLDHFKADVKSPEFVDLGGYGSPGKVYAAGSNYNQSGSVNDTSYFLSSVYKMDESTSLYATYNKVNAVLGSANFGGVGVAANTPAALNVALKSEATLFELGYKFVLLQNKLYNSVSAYRQVRSDPDRFGNVADRIAKGVEFETVYQQSKSLYVIANFSYQDVFRNGGTAIFQSNADYYKLQPNGSYTSKGGGLTPVPYSRRYSGAPNWLSSARLNYRFDSGFSLGIGPQFTGAQKANGEGTLHIPTQYKLNATVAYTTGPWNYQVNIDNLTNRHNWTVGDPDFTGNTVIYQEKPLTISFSSRYRF